MNKIFLHNFPYPQQTANLSNNADYDQVKMFMGFEYRRPENLVKKTIVQDVINSLLVHDKITLKLKDIARIMMAFGLNDSLELLKQDYFEMVEDRGIRFGVVSGKKGTEATSFFDGDSHYMPSAFEWLEKNLEKGPYNKEVVKLLLLNAERNIVPIDTNDMSTKVYNELNYDLRNGNVTKNLKIGSKSKDKVQVADALKIVRLMHINAGMIYGEQLNCNNVLLDGEIKTLLSYKLPPMMQTDQNNSIDLIKDITNQKGIPDLADLYLNKVISIQDIISIRENFNGLKFRQWLSDSNYNQEETTQVLMNNFSTINLKISKALRFAVTNTIGFVDPIGGLAVSAVDSFIIDRIINGWHPNFFLDNVLKSEIDQKILEYKLDKEKTRIKSRFPKTGRNDPCPCGSEKKFKNCCGKIAL